MFIKENVLPLTFGMLCIICLVILRIADPFFLKQARETGFDQFQRVSPREYIETPVRIVDIDEASLQEFGQFPWSRRLIADLTERLGQMGAASIAFDILFVEPDRLSPSRLVEDPEISTLLDEAKLLEDIPDNDDVFADTLAHYPTILGFARVQGDVLVAPEIKAGFAYTGTNPADAVPVLDSVTQNLPELQDASTGLGSISLSPDEAISVVRKVPLLWSDGEKVYPSLALESLRVAQGVSTILVNAVTRAGTVVQSVRVGDFEIPTTPNGAIWMHYSEETRDRYISAKDVLADEVEQATVDAINGHIVLIGTSAVGLYDIRATSIGENVPGVSIHAQLLEQVISGSFVYRSDWVDGLEVFGFVIVGIYVLVLTLVTGPVLSLLSGGVVGSGILAGTWLAYYRTGLLVDPTFPMVGGLMVYLAVVTFRFFIADRQKRQIRKAFSQYVAPAVLDQLDKEHGELTLGGELKQMTIMFTDVRNFTSFSERLPPVEVVQFLNSLLGGLSEEIIRESGTIDKYIGDSIMAFWNAPIEVPDHEKLACRAALQMRQSLVEFNESNAAKDETGTYDPIGIGIGINTGQGCVGNMGSATRFDYSVIGDAVNTASRVEAACKEIGYDIVVSEETAKGVSDFATLEAGTISLKGKSERVPVHIVVGDETVASSSEFTRLANAHQDLIAAMRSGAANWEARLATCKDLAGAVSLQLTGFYDIIPGRKDDFVTNQSEAMLAVVN